MGIAQNTRCDDLYGLFTTIACAPHFIKLNKSMCFPHLVSYAQIAVWFYLFSCYIFQLYQKIKIKIRICQGQDKSLLCQDP